MNIYIPQNIFATLFSLTLPKELKKKVVFKESSLLAAAIKQDSNSVALIPSCDLIHNMDFFVSSRYGIAFDGLLSNSYLYFPESSSSLSELYLWGDVSVNEILLVKVLFAERYNSEVEIKLESKKPDLLSQNSLIAGNDNLFKRHFETGISFADEIAEMLDYPYVNYLLVSGKEETVKEFHKLLPDKFDEKIENNLSDSLSKIGLDEDVAAFVSMNLNSVYFELLENEINGLKELYKQVFYHGFIDDIFDMKLVD